MPSLREQNSFSVTHNIPAKVGERFTRKISSDADVLRSIVVAQSLRISVQTFPGENQSPVARDIRAAV